jgi:alpha-1,2-mannosyltransferase
VRRYRRSAFSTPGRGARTSLSARRAQRAAVPGTDIIGQGLSTAPLNGEPPTLQAPGTFTAPSSEGNLVTQAGHAVAPEQAETSGSSRRAGIWLLAAGTVCLLLVLGVYVADLVHYLPGMTEMRDLAVYRAGGLITRHVSPPYNPHAYAPLYTWHGPNAVSFTYSPFAAIVFAVGSLLPWTALRWAMTLASLAALALSVWLTFGALGYYNRRVRAGATLLVTAAALLTEPVQQNLALGQINVLLMLLIAVDLLLPRQHWWNGIGIGVAAGIKLIPLIFIPYLLLTGRFRQAAVAAGTFVATIGLGYLILPHDSSKYWREGLFLKANRIVFLGTRGNQSLRGIVTRFADSVAGGSTPWLAAAAVVAIIGLLTAAALCWAGHPVPGMLACALTGLLVSPLSWDHHWVWVVPGMVLASHLAVRTRGWARMAWWAVVALLLFVFGAWPQFWDHTMGLTPAGWVWYGPTQYFAYGDNPAYHEYHWNGLQIVAGNSFVLAGLVALAGLAVAAIRLREPAVRGFAGAPQRVREALHRP